MTLGSGQKHDSRSRDMRQHIFIYMQKATERLEVEQGYKLSKPASRDILSPARLQTVPPNGDQVFLLKPPRQAAVPPDAPK